MEIKQLSLPQTEIKFAGAAFAFSGYASVFGGIDSYGDTIEKGAYEKTLIERNGRPIRMRWNHYGEVIGKWTNMREDEKGLYVEGELTPGHSKAADVFALLKHGAIDGLSIGYRVNAFEQLSQDRRLLKEIDLVEISVVEEPADLNARIGEVKSALEKANSLKEIESLLRDVGGFSRVDAKHLVSKVNSLYQREAETAKAKQDIENIIRQYVR